MRDVVVVLGFDLIKGCLDVSVYFFMGGCGLDDVRMITRYKVDDLFEGLLGCVYEVGYSVYE